MTPKDKKTMVIEAFFQRTKKEGRLPHDLLVPQYREWIGKGLQPVPCDNYQVEYVGGAREEAERLRMEDPTLKTLQRSLDFELDEPLKTLRVYRLGERMEKTVLG